MPVGARDAEAPPRPPSPPPDSAITDVRNQMGDSAVRRFVCNEGESPYFFTPIEESVVGKKKGVQRSEGERGGKRGTLWWK